MLLQFFFVLLLVSADEVFKLNLFKQQHVKAEVGVLKTLLEKWIMIEEVLIKGSDQSKDPECDCDWKYLKHYKAKGCHPVYANTADKDKLGCNCPIRFDCSKTDELNVDEKACFFRNHVYPIGSEINTTNPCEMCYCGTHYFTESPVVTCDSGHCGIYDYPSPEGCHKVYEGKQCCPTHIECRHEDSENTDKDMEEWNNIPFRYTNDPPICEYNGKMYYKGEEIHTDVSCIICICSENWTGIDSESCWEFDCMLETTSWELKRGCIPIYHKSACCPIDYRCPDKDVQFRENNAIYTSTDRNDMCYFEGQYYPVGHVLDIKHPTNCVICTCKIPPDFTCIQRSCPPPTNGDYENCRRMYFSQPNVCCPDWRCVEKNGSIVIDDCGKDIDLMCQFKSEIDVFPVNKDEWQNFCKDTTSVLKCMTEYNKKCDRNKNFKDTTKDSLLWSNSEVILNALQQVCSPLGLFYKDFANELQCYSDFAEVNFGLPLVLECLGEKGHYPVHKQVLTNLKINDVNNENDTTGRNETQNTHMCTDYSYVATCLLLKLEQECGTSAVIHPYKILESLDPLNDCLTFYISSDYFHIYKDIKREERLTL